MFFMYYELISFKREFLRTQNNMEIKKNFQVITKKTHFLIRNGHGRH